MEDKQLNFNRPLLSVRHFSPTTTTSQKDSTRKTKTSLPTISPSPSYRSELQSGPLRNAGSVPFVWEQSPGRPKDETKTQKHTKNLVPKLPPGRISKPKKQDSSGSRSIFPFESSKETKKERRGDGVRKVVNRENEKPQITYGPNFLTSDESEEDSDFEYDEHVNMSYKVCGLLPHFCLKGSIGLLNPLPGLSVRTRLPISSANGSCSGSSSASSQPARAAVYEHRTLAKQQKEQKDQTILKNEKTLQNNLIDSDMREVNLQKKGLISFKELLATENAKEASSLNHPVEKTLYIDTIHKEGIFDISHKAEPDEAIFNISHKTETDEGIFDISHKAETDEGIFNISNKAETDEGIFDISHKAEIDEGIFDISHVPTDPLQTDLNLKVDRVKRQNELELPAPPPLPKSPSDSWLWRTLPSMSSKTPSLRANHKYLSSNTRAKPENSHLQNPQGQLHPIPEI